MRRKKAMKYLGGIVGHDKAMVLKKWTDIEEKMDKKIRQWSMRVGSSVQDRMLVIKLMFLSLIWYHASIMPIPEGLLESVEKKVLSFLWSGGMFKVRKAQLYKGKKEGGLGF